jgi:Mce-associated membrane protein
VTESNSPGRSARRRASRPAGPHRGEPAIAAVPIDTESKPVKRPSTPISVPRRRPGNANRVGWIALAASLIGIAVLAGGVSFEMHQQHQADARQARAQRFVDTATQLLVNIFSHNQDSVDKSVTSFVDNTSGPLRAQLTSNNNVENLKTLFRHTDSTSEAVVNGAALEGIDNVTDNASVLVALRVTVTSREGVNQPSEAYRMRVIMHEDEKGRMTVDDMKWPNGGN